MTIWIYRVRDRVQEVKSTNKTIHFVKFNQFSCKNKYKFTSKEQLIKYRKNNKNKGKEENYLI